MKTRAHKLGFSFIVSTDPLVRQMKELFVLNQFYDRFKLRIDLGIIKVSMLYFKKMTNNLTFTHRQRRAWWTMTPCVVLRFRCGWSLETHIIWSNHYISAPLLWNLHFIFFLILIFELNYVDFHSHRMPNTHIYSGRVWWWTSCWVLVSDQKHWKSDLNIQKNIQCANELNFFSGMVQP